MIFINKKLKDKLHLRKENLNFDDEICQDLLKLSKQTFKLNWEDFQSVLLRQNLILILE